MIQPTEMMLFGCFVCGAEGCTACPNCVNTIRIDPETTLPPDVLIVDGRYVHNENPNPEAMARSIKTPLCDDCIERQNELNPDRQVLTAAERHARGFCRI